MKKIFFCTLLLVLGLNFLQASKVAVAGYSDDPYMMPYYTGKILPTPQKVEYLSEYLTLDKTGIVLNEIKEDDPRLQYLLERIKRYGGNYEFTSKATNDYSCLIHLNSSKTHAPDQAEGYTIKSEGKNIYLKGQDFRGLLWAISSLNQMIFVKGNKTIVKTVNISDWPNSPVRGMLGESMRHGIKHFAHFMVAFKFNTVDFRGRIPGNAGHLLDARGKKGFDVKKFNHSLKLLSEVFNPLELKWYAGCWELSKTAFEKKDSTLQLDCSSEETFNYFYNTIGKPIALAGGNLSIQFDDHRYPMHPNDVKKFGTAANADFYWVTRYYDKLKEINPQIRIMFCPVYYFGPSGHSYQENRDEYLNKMGTLPEAIDIYWTGPRVKGNKIDASDVQWVVDRIKRQPFVFQNGVGIPHIYLYHYGSDPVYNLKTWYYDGFSKDIEGYFLNGGGMQNSAALVSIAEWVWNTKSFDPELTIENATKKLLGAEAYLPLVELNKTLSFFDKYYSNPANPQAMINQKIILNEYEKLGKELEAFNESFPSAKNGFWLDIPLSALSSFIKNLAKMEKNQYWTKFSTNALETQKQAEKEAEFNSQTDIFRSAVDFSGGMGPKFYSYKNKLFDVKRRLCTWIYGMESFNPEITTIFEIDPFPPAGDYKLIISGLDDDSTSKCPIRISLNGNTIFEGANPFSNQDWDIKEFIVAAEYLQRNNTLIISNLSKSSMMAGPPFFMLNYAILRKTVK